MIQQVLGQKKDTGSEGSNYFNNAHFQAMGEYNAEGMNYDNGNDPESELYNESEYTFRYSDYVDPDSFDIEPLPEDFHLTWEGLTQHFDTYNTFMSLGKVEKYFKHLERFDPKEVKLPEHLQKTWVEWNEKPYYDTLFSYYHILPDRVKESQVVI